MATVADHFRRLDEQAESTAGRLFPHLRERVPRFLVQLLEMDNSNQKLVMYHALEVMISSKTEHLLKIIVGWSQGTETGCRRLSFWELLKKLGLCGSKLARYGEVVVLREICNCIKHQGGRATKEVAEAGYAIEEGAEIVLTEEHLYGFLFSSREFLIAVCEAAPAGDEDGLLDLLMSGSL